MTFYVRDPASSLPATKPAPKSQIVPVPFYYAPSNDGTDENLLVLLHGLGDTHVPFSRLGRQFNLPQTAVLALRAPERIPFLDEEAFQWYPSFDQLGELIDRPNPTSTLNLMSKLVDHLINDCLWPARSIHLFGFAQGGSIVVEFGVKWWRSRTEDQRPLGSIVSISGPMLSYPTLSKTCPTPLLVFHRPESMPSGAMAAFKKAYDAVTEVKMGEEDGGMPRSKSEWQPIMRFWSERLKRRQADGLYEVIGPPSSHPSGNEDDIIVEM